MAFPLLTPERVVEPACCVVEPVCLAVPVFSAELGAYSNGSRTLGIRSSLDLTDTSESLDHTFCKSFSFPPLCRIFAIHIYLQVFGHYTSIVHHFSLTRFVIL